MVNTSEVGSQTVSAQEYIRALLVAVASVVLALFTPVFVLGLKGLSSQKATGLMAVAGGFTESMFSGWFGLLFLLFFSLFYFAARLRRVLLRFVFFWIPASLSCILGLGLWATLVYMFRAGGSR